MHGGVKTPPLVCDGVPVGPLDHVAQPHVVHDRELAHLDGHRLRATHGDPQDQIALLPKPDRSPRTTTRPHLHLYPEATPPGALTGSRSRW